jgi:rsbT co-antagonist protein RsbR
MQQLETLAHGARQQTFHVYLQAYEERMERQRRALAELSTPVIQVYENVLVLPLVGAIDTERARRVMEELLLGITNYQAELVIIDITGVPVVDTSVANHLMQTVKAARLLGAQSILVGISREIAQTLVHLQIDLSAVVTRSNLQAGIEYALEQMGLGIGPGEEGLPAEMMEEAVGEEMGPAHSTDRR